jgi:hypothetical protein
MMDKWLAVGVSALMVALERNHERVEPLFELTFCSVFLVALHSPLLELPKLEWVPGHLWLSH